MARDLAHYNDVSGLMAKLGKCSISNVKIASSNLA